MRTHGRLTRWNAERGFGFIEPAAGSSEIFVHISAFPHDGVRPLVGELISFEIEQRGDGKSRAVRLMRPGSRPTVAQSRRIPPPATRRGALSAVIGPAVFLSLAWYGATWWFAQEPPAPPSRSIPDIPEVRTASFTCDGRMYCSQMTSCAEAKYFSKQCPGTKMDGDGDGVPCESQWCPGG